MEQNHYDSQNIEKSWTTTRGPSSCTSSTSPRRTRPSRTFSFGSGAGIVHTLNVGDGRVVGIDPLNTELTDAMADSNADFVAGVGEFLPFPDDSFTVVVSINVLDHCVEPSRVVKEVRRVLTEDSRFLLELKAFELPKSLRD